jgi:hypothetical protein
MNNTIVLYVKDVWKGSGGVCINSIFGEISRGNQTDPQYNLSLLLAWLLAYNYGVPGA